MVSLIRQSDYENYDYRQFWQDSKRDYEDKSERLAVRKLFKSIDTEGKIFIDLGCGFARLFNEYRDFAKIILVDYSLNNIKNARDLITDFLNNDLEKLKNIYFIVADINNLPFKSKTADTILTIRVIHHLSEPIFFFKEVKRIIKNHGCFILEYANKRNLKNILKFLCGIIRQSPFNLTSLKIGDTILNFHPVYIKKMLQDNGFKILKQLSVSNFRLSALKKTIGLKFLLFLENIYQNLFSFAKTGPSIFLKTLYCEANGLKDSLNDSSDGVKKFVSFSDIREILICPCCKQDKLEFLKPGNIYCTSCRKNFKVDDNIYNFRI